MQRKQSPNYVFAGKGQDPRPPRGDLALSQERVVFQWPIGQLGRFPIKWNPVDRRKRPKLMDLSKLRAPVRAKLALGANDQICSDSLRTLLIFNGRRRTRQMRLAKRDLAS
jgi:hypothetical protein